MLVKMGIWSTRHPYEVASSRFIAGLFLIGNLVVEAVLVHKQKIDEIVSFQLVSFIAELAPFGFGIHLIRGQI